MGPELNPSSPSVENTYLQFLGRVSLLHFEFQKVEVLRVFKSLVGEFLCEVDYKVIF